VGGWVGGAAAGGVLLERHTQSLLGVAQIGGNFVVSKFCRQLFCRCALMATLQESLPLYKHAARLQRQSVELYSSSGICTTKNK